jgi:hypothetical protein
MSIWIILSWVFVLILTAINVFLFFKLKDAGEQMIKMAFPGAKNMTDALGKMQQMMQGIQGLQGMQKGGGLGGFGGSTGDAKLKAAMNLLQNMQKTGKH